MNNIYGICFYESKKTPVSEILRAALGNLKIAYTYEDDVLIFDYKKFILMKHLQQLSKQYPETAIFVVEISDSFPNEEKHYTISNGKLSVKKRKLDLRIKKQINRC